MAWNLDSDRPIYAQLVEILQMRIVSGQYKPGARIPSVRDMAAEAAVNPNTMQRAFAELERDGLIVTQRTSGRSVTQDEAAIRRVKEQLAKNRIEDFITGMRRIGYSGQEIINMLEDVFKEENHE